MENIILTRGTLHSNTKLEFSLVKLVHSDSDNSGWLFGWLARLFSNVDEVWSVKVLHLFKQSYATGSNTPMRSGLGKMEDATGKFQLIPPQVSDNNKVIGTCYSSFRGGRRVRGKRKPKWNTLLMSTTLKWYSV